MLPSGLKLSSYSSHTCGVSCVLQFASEFLAAGLEAIIPCLREDRNRVGYEVISLKQWHVMMELYPGYLEDHFNIHKLSGGAGVSPPEYMTTASTQFAPAPLRMGMYERHHHQQQQPAPPPAPVVGMWNSEPYKVDSGGQATSGSTIMEGDAKFDHTGLEEVPHMDELEPEGDDADQEASKPRDKVLRRLAQNREAARKSRLRKKAYIQQLETSRIKLAQLEQELQRARQQQGVYGGPNPADLLRGGGFAAAPMDPGVAAFEIEYGHWVDEQKRHTGELRGALQAQGTTDLELRMLVETGLANYDHLFRIKSAAACSDVFCVMSGLCRSPAERFFLWIGGFRPSEVLNLLHPQLQPLTDQQLMMVYKLQQSSAQAEDALSQGMEKLQQMLSASLLATDDPFAAPADAYGMGTNSAVEKLKGLVGFVQQADYLRQETLQNMYKILTIRQAARGLLALGDYFERLRALSSLWAARPRESAIS